MWASPLISTSWCSPFAVDRKYLRFEPDDPILPTLQCGHELIVNGTVAGGRLQGAYIVDGVKAAIRQGRVDFTLFGFQCGNAVRQSIEFTLFLETELARLGNGC